MERHCINPEKKEHNIAQKMIVRQQNIEYA
jgi:hypothetical protein